MFDIYEISCSFFLNSSHILLEFNDFADDRPGVSQMSTNLTLFQTTNFRLFQSLQTTILNLMKRAESSPKL